jgi:lipocalin
MTKFTEHEKYEGKWYEVYSDFNLWKWTMQECATSNYSKSDAPSTPETEGDMKIVR